MIGGINVTTQSASCDVLLVNPPYQRRAGSGLNAPLGLAYLASFVRSKGFLPKIIDCAPYFSTIEDDSLEDLEFWLSKKISEIKPKLAIGVGPCTVSSARSLSCIEKTCRKAAPGKPILYGGPLASIPGQGWFFFNYLHAFAVIPGDAEIILAQLLDKLRNNDDEKVKGVIYDTNENFSVNLIEKLDELPFPARDLFESSLYSPSIRRNLFTFPFANIVCSRGCPNNCGFCSASSLRGGRQNKRSVENIGKEILTLSQQGIKSLTFYDDCLFSNQSSANESVIEFSQVITNSGKDIVWQIEMRPDIVEVLEEESIRIMYKNGCRQINIGAEKGTVKGLKEINKTLSPEQTIEACKNIKAAAPSLRVTATFLIGGPDESRKDALETIEFSKKLGLIFAHFYPLEIYPGTKLYKDKFGDDAKIWFTAISQNSIYRGSLIYEDILKKEEISNLICDAYNAFYQRQEWKVLAKRLLGNYYNDIESTIQTWSGNPRW